MAQQDPNMRFRMKLDGKSTLKIRLSKKSGLYVPEGLDSEPRVRDNAIRTRPVKRRGHIFSKKAGKIIFYDLGNTADGLGGWDEHVINSSNYSAVVTALNAVLTVHHDDWQTTFRPLSTDPGKNNLRVMMDTEEVDKMVLDGETSWSGSITRDTVNIIDETPELAGIPVNDLPFYNVNSGLFVHPSIGVAGGNFKVTTTTNIDDPHTEFTISDQSEPVHVYLQRSVFSVSGYKLVSSSSPTLSPSGPSPGGWSPELGLRWWTSGVCGVGLDYLSQSQSFSITGSGSKIEDSISGNYVSWSRSDVFADPTTVDYDPGDYYALYWAALNHTIDDLIAYYGYVPTRRTENWNAGYSGLWIGIWGGAPAVLCLYPTGGTVSLGPGPPGTAGTYYASGSGAHTVDIDPIGDLNLGPGNGGAVNIGSFADSLLMAINQGDEWYYVWNRYAGGGG